MTFIWVDDNPKREDAAKNLERLKKIKVHFINVKNKDLYAKLESVTRDHREPDLLLIDHKLDKVTGGLIKTGSTVAEVLREVWSKCPVVCITAVKLEDISLHKQDIYEEVIEDKNISHHYKMLISIAAAFKLMNRKPPKDTGGIIRLIKAPQGDKDRLVTVMPETLKGHLNDQSLPMKISRWTRHSLLSRPGFLYDRLWAATLLGVKATSFKKIEKYFTDAIYDGIFADAGNDKWWQSKLRSIVVSKVKAQDEIFPWVLGRSLPGIKKSDYSTCYACGEELPETVAYIDDTPASTQAAMHLGCTKPHPRYESSLFFEDIRVMKEAE